MSVNTTLEQDFSGKSIQELSDLFQQFAISEDRLLRAKEAEAIKSAFYRTLLKEREKSNDLSQEVFDVVEENFKAMYAAFKKERAEYNRQLDNQKEENLKAKQAVIDDLRALLDKDEDVSATFPAFREIQNRWRETGPVPAQNVRDINNFYQLYVEQFYDKLNINRELRDLDFKKNYEAKILLCEKAEHLAGNDKVLDAFNELQKLHDEWKELGPVDKQYREELWERFKQATTVINKKHQDYFKDVKQAQEDNLAAKEALCVRVEEIAAAAVDNSNLWNSLSKDIEAIQAEWRKIGYATKKENQKIYERFRVACDAFFSRKREFYSSYKDDLEENLRKKLELCEKAEALKSSVEWKKTTDQLIDLQKKWKEIGAVPRKKADAVWARFRAACDEFFSEKEKAFKAGRNVRQQAARHGVSEKDRLVAKYRALEQEILTKENNILFFGQTKDNPLLNQMRDNIVKAKQELELLAGKIKQMESQNIGETKE